VQRPKQATDGGDYGQTPQERAAGRDGYGRILTIPNLVSFARLLGIVVFLWLFFVVHANAWAVAVLVVGGFSDWVDGFLARRLDQVSRLGELVDPLADRLYILATLVAFTAAGVVPLWFTVALLGREATLLVGLAVLRRHGYGPPPVHYVGKTATFVLLGAFPALLLAHAVSGTRTWSYPVGWGLAWWGLGLYWIAGGLYVAQIVAVVRASHARPLTPL
jgi:cardiolipin synthase